MSVVILRGDAACLPLPDASVDLIVTSPPYFGLRSYVDTVVCKKCRYIRENGADPHEAWPDYDAHVKAEHVQHYDGQIGSEATPREFIAALLDCTREWVRVLKPSGSLFVNLGDKYDSGTTAPRVNPGTVKDGQGQGWHQGTPRVSLGRPKSLMGMPWRYAIGCIDDLGLILRAEIVWAKPNSLPESVTDRVRRSHEQVFHFTRQPRYFAAVDEVREAHSEGTHPGRTRSVGNVSGNGVTHRTFAGNTDGFNPLGKLPGSVWEIPSQPLTVPAHLGVDHFAAFPMELPRRIILGWSPSGICTECGEGRRPVALREQEWTGRTNSGRAKRQLADGIGLSRGHNAAGYPHTVSRTTITGYACACPQPDALARPAVVLDPFGGTGTTALVAAMHGRTGISVDRSADYCRLARWRTSDPAERARALGVPKPPPVTEGQRSLFDDLEAS